MRYTLILTDNVTVIDSLSKKKNGILILWAKVNKVASSVWSKLNNKSPKTPWSKVNNKTPKTPWAKVNNKSPKTTWNKKNKPGNYTS